MGVVAFFIWHCLAVTAFSIRGVDSFSLQNAVRRKRRFVCSHSGLKLKCFINYITNKPIDWICHTSGCVTSSPTTLPHDSPTIPNLALASVCLSIYVSTRYWSNDKSIMRRILKTKRLNIFMVVLFHRSLKTWALLADFSQVLFHLHNRTWLILGFINLADAFLLGCILVNSRLHAMAKDWIDSE